MMRERLRRRWLLGVASLFALVGVQGGARAASRNPLFRGSGAPAPAAPDDATPHMVFAADGVHVHTLELLSGPRAPVLVHFHNQRETAVEGVPFARSLRDRGIGVVLVEYRGHGDASALDPTEEGLYLDAEAVLDDLARRGYGPWQVILSGVSLGTGVAAEMARRGRGSALVLTSPYTSIPGSLEVDSFDTLSKAPQIGVPTLVVHGDADDVVPYWMGAAVARAIPGARLMSIDGGTHHDLLEREPRRILEAIVALTHL